MTGQADRFAIWRVRRRTETELLMRQIGGPTASWFMISPRASGTRLSFGSALIPAPSGRVSLGYRGLTPFHRLYSHGLLRAARAGLSDR
ncbi:hypothetical protein ACRARG_08390 [Pseudooceanicola sp. C21-150M6]|uniref:hypothetical protein n=1 Tax=Pseudooceanicola sp. C21-150M6 TaxID=3434355 RepID=UPI003D7F948F